MFGLIPKQRSYAVAALKTEFRKRIREAARTSQAGACL
jgi:hypothetical protein